MCIYTPSMHTNFLLVSELHASISVEFALREKAKQHAVTGQVLQYGKGLGTRRVLNAILHDLNQAYILETVRHFGRSSTGRIRK